MPEKTIQVAAFRRVERGGDGFGVTPGQARERQPTRPRLTGPVPDETQRCGDELGGTRAAHIECCRPLDPPLATTSHADQLDGMTVVQPWSAVLWSERGYVADTRHFRVVHVVVELVEGLLQAGLLTDLRADGDPITIGRHDEVPMVRWTGERARWIGEPNTGKHEQRDRCDCDEQDQLGSGLHGRTPIWTRDGLDDTRLVKLRPLDQT